MGTVIPRGAVKRLALAALSVSSLFGASLSVQDIQACPGRLSSPMERHPSSSSLRPTVRFRIPTLRRYSASAPITARSRYPATWSYVDPDLTLADVKKHVKEFGYAGCARDSDSTQKLGAGDRRDHHPGSGYHRPIRPDPVSGPHR